MSTQTISIQDFTCDVPAAKRAAMSGPVFITEHERNAFVLLNIDDYYRITGQSGRSLLSVMDGIPGGENIDFDPPRLQIQSRPIAFD